MKVVFAGGGSGGPVSPLLAIYEKLKKRYPVTEAIWLGTKKGPEKKMVEPYGLEFKTISAGKFRRYFSLANFIDPIKVLIGYLQAKSVLRKFKPDVVLTAGGFIAVPVVWAAASLKIPSFIHQQDLAKGLANKLMQKKATAITVTFADSLKDYPQEKTYLTSNPVRQQVFNGDKQKGSEIFKLDINKPTIFIVGGGQGAEKINQVVLEVLPQLLSKYQIVHQTGAGKAIDQEINNLYDRQTLKSVAQNYRGYEFLGQEIFDAYALADLVVCRSGLGTLTELSALGKAAILIPIPGHQEKNAQYFAKDNTAKILWQADVTKENLVDKINQLMNTPSDLQQLSRNIATMMDKQAADKYVDLIENVLGK